MEDLIGKKSLHEKKSLQATISEEEQEEEEYSQFGSRFLIICISYHSRMTKEIDIQKFQQDINYKGEYR